MSKLYHRSGPEQPETPVIVSVPHAGRTFPQAMVSLARQTPEQLRTLEDRHADCLAVHAAAAGHQVLVARIGRGWIDLNRDEREVDPVMVTGGWPGAVPTAKVRGGLGLVPRQTSAGGAIWRGSLQSGDISRRIAQYHRPYHEALGAMLAAARARFGVAVLLDLHSMPTLAAKRDLAPAHLVVGDLFGRACDARFSWRVVDEARDAGFRTALNTPYAGGYILARHGRPTGDVHAVQLEVARSLYLDAAMDQPGPGAAAIARLVERLADALADEALSFPLSLAAE